MEPSDRTADGRQRRLTPDGYTTEQPALTPALSLCLMQAPTLTNGRAFHERQQDQDNSWRCSYTVSVPQSDAEDERRAIEQMRRETPFRFRLTDGHISHIRKVEAATKIDNPRLRGGGCRVTSATDGSCGNNRPAEYPRLEKSPKQQQS